MKKRIAIYCYYSANGKTYEETNKQLNDLRINVDYLIVVVNGIIISSDCFEKADRLIIRPNQGLDAGAYKSVILNPEIKSLIKEYDELVLCNSTFWGPFCGFNEIFRKMEKEKVDFWGMNFFNNCIISHIQSFFLVYRKTIINDELFYKFFEDNISEDTNDLKSVCYWFENALFDYLKNKYSYGCYIDNLRYNIYEYPDKCIEMGLPILKKKVFSMNYDRNRVLSSIKLIRDNFNYSVDELLKEIGKEYRITITKEEVDNYKMPDNIIAEEYPVSKADINNVMLMCKKCQNLYIYGLGNYAYYLFNKLNKCTDIKGFIVSDDQYKDETVFMGKSVYALGEIVDKEKKDVLIGLNRINTNQVKDKLLDFNNIICLWN